MNKLAGLFKRQDIPKMLLVGGLFFMAEPMTKTAELINGQLEGLDVLKWEWNVFITACYIGGFYMVIVILRAVCQKLQISLPVVPK